MLGNMADPKAIGPAMAVALLTTLYGAFIAECSIFANDNISEVIPHMRLLTGRWSLWVLEI